MFSRIAISLATLAFSTFALADTRSVTTSPKLMALLNTMSEIASEGASLEYFGFTENRTEMVAGRDCHTVSAADVTAYFEEAARNLLKDYDQTPDPEALNDFVKIVGTSDYTSCSDGVTGGMSLNTYDIFRAIDGSYAIQFEFGYED